LIVPLLAAWPPESQVLANVVAALHQQAGQRSFSASGHQRSTSGDIWLVKEAVGSADVGRRRQM